MVHGSLYWFMAPCTGSWTLYRTPSTAPRPCTGLLALLLDPAPSPGTALHRALVQPAPSPGTPVPVLLGMTVPVFLGMTVPVLLDVAAGGDTGTW